MALTELFTSNIATAAVTTGGTGAPVSGTSETWTVSSSAAFGAAATGVSQFHVGDPAATSETIAVTNVSGTTWTVTRGAEGTTPVAHAPGFSVYQVTTEGFLSSVLTTAKADASGIGGPTVTGLGLGMASLNPVYANTSFTLTNEQINVILCTATVNATVTKLGFLNVQAAATPGAGVNEMAVYTEAGTLVALTGDMTTAMESAGFCEGTIANPGGITSYALVAGTNYYLALLTSFTGTVPKAQGYSTGLSVAGAAGALNGHYLSRFLGSQATMPGTITPSSMSAQNDTVFAYAR